MPKFIDLTDRQFGNWTVLSKAPRTSYATMWFCRCVCGLVRSISGGNLTSGKTKSCRHCYPLDPTLASFRGLLRDYKKHASKRHLTFELTEGEFRTLTSGVCHYCGRSPEQIWMRGETNGHYRYNGIDRKDNTQGYVVENCVSCCGICNKAKRTMPYQEFLDWIKRVYERMNLA